MGRNPFTKKLSNMKLIIFTIIYFLALPLYVFADPREGLAGTAEAGWMGPLAAIVIIATAIIVAKKIKKSPVEKELEV